MPEETLPTRFAQAAGRKAAGLLRVRWLMRAPIWVYRVRLGALFGSRMLMLEHIGRNSGLRRYVVLEVVDHPTPGTYVIVSGFGAGAQWFRNVRSNPAVRVYLGSRKPEHATARPLNREQARASLDTYAAKHPRAWHTLSSLLDTTLGSTGADELADLPLVALELERTPA